MVDFQIEWRITDNNIESFLRFVLNNVAFLNMSIRIEKPCH